MRLRFVVDGPKYSRHKASFKKLLREHGLRWRGGRTEFLWESGRETVRAEYERDEARDVTLRATLVWEGRAKTRFLNELKAWVFELGGSAEAAAARSRERESRVEEKLAAWDRLNRPDVEALRATGRPDAWIERDVKAWRRRRRAKRKELLGG